MKKTNTWLMVAVLAMAATTALAQGRSNDRDREGDRGRDNAKDKESAEVQTTINFTLDQRRAISEFLGEQRNSGANCPPGLAKKNNGCQPPGQAKRYQLGQPLPRDIRFQQLPEQISVRIGVPPAGYVYGMIDGDLVKLVIGTLLVVDAIDGL